MNPGIHDGDRAAVACQRPSRVVVRAARDGHPKCQWLQLEFEYAHWQPDRPRDPHRRRRRYWCEGAKNKPHRRADRVTFTNSDPELISFFLLFLDIADIPRSDLAFQLQIHETADVASAERFWLALTGARPEQFRKTSVKRHNPETTRKNTSDGYQGCLRIDVRRSCVLYRKIEGWASAVTGVAAAPD